MMFSLISIAVLSDVAIPIPLRSEGLGVTAWTVVPGRVADGERPRPPMLRVVEVEPGKPGACTGLRLGDMILGVTSYDVFKPEDIAYPPITPEAFERFPPTVGTMNTASSILVYRPSLDATAQLRVRFSREPQPWPSGSLGVVVKDVPGEGIPGNGPGKASRVEVVRVHPYGTADRLGIRAGDVVVSLELIGHVDEHGLEFMPMSRDVKDVRDLIEALKTYPKGRCVDAVKLMLKRGNEIVTVAVPAAKLR
jgi:C-terminal processing protease CtpA/Prc